MGPTSCSSCSGDGASAALPGAAGACAVASGAALNAMQIASATSPGNAGRAKCLPFLSIIADSIRPELSFPCPPPATISPKRLNIPLLVQVGVDHIRDAAPVRLQQRPAIGDLVDGKQRVERNVGIDGD